MQWSAFNYCEIERGVFTSAECAEIVETHRRYNEASGHLPAVRECTLFWVEHDAWTAWIFERIAAAVSKWNGRYGFVLDPEQHTALQLARYRPGQRYDWHMDVGSGPMSLRKISLVVELSDPAEHGGYLEVFYGEHADHRMHLDTGDVAIFPSWIMHRAVTPVRGERWSLAAWVCGPEPFR